LVKLIPSKNFFQLCAEGISDCNCEHKKKTENIWSREAKDIAEIEVA